MVKIPFIKKEDFRLHLTCDGCILSEFVNDGGSKDVLGIQIDNEWNIAPITAAYLLACDGKSSHKDIMKKLKIPFSILGDEIVSGLEEIDLIDFSENEIESKKLDVTGTFDSYCPLHMSVELTDYCNFRCKHCYVSASPDKIEIADYDKVMSLLKKLSENGVTVIELTGGECTTYPKFKEVLKYCSENFRLVSLVSNGYLIGADKDFADYISSFNNVVVQISIDGMEKFHDEFRSKKNAFKNACKAVKYLKEKGVIIRIASTIVEENVDEIVDLYKLCKELNVDAWATSTVEDFGRGEDLEGIGSKAYINERLTTLLKPYIDDNLFAYRVEAMKNFIDNKDINCGGGWRTFALNATSGNLRTCLFLDQNNVVGNIYTDDYYDIFNEEKTMQFKNAPNPTKNLATCKDCQYSDECVGCFAKALKVCAEKYPECPWKKKYLNNINI